MVVVMDDVLIEVLTTSSRSVIGRRDTYRRAVTNVGAEVHAVRDIDPKESSNILALLA